MCLDQSRVDLGTCSLAFFLSRNVKSEATVLRAHRSLKQGKMVLQTFDYSSVQKFFCNPRRGKHDIRTHTRVYR